jgi:hypothetical protein
MDDEPATEAEEDGVGKGEYEANDREQDRSLLDSLEIGD